MQWEWDGRGKGWWEANQLAAALEQQASDKPTFPPDSERVILHIMSYFHVTSGKAIASTFKSIWNLSTRGRGEEGNIFKEKNAHLFNNVSVLEKDIES